MNRRSFIKTAAVAAAAPAIVPSSVFTRPAPSDILQFGCIGVGRQGQGDMQELIYRGLETGARVVAVCDVDAHRLQDAQWLAERIYTVETGKDATGSVKAYRDFRQMLLRKDIDGVLIVTPDFWHAAHAVAAAEAGKDIYVEKPLTFTIAEGRKLVSVVARRNRILQVGSQQRSDIHFLMACEIVRNGRIGALKTIRASIPEDQGQGDARRVPVPPNLNYDFWMGPTAEAPFSEDRVHPQLSYDRPGWLQIERYCLGMITGWGSHMMDIAQWGHGSDLSGPVSVEARGEFPDRGLFDVHTKFKAEAVYADGVRLLMETGDPAGVRFEGDQGWVFVQRGGIKASDPAILKWKPGQGEVKLVQSGNHMKNFLEAVRTRRAPAAPAEVGHRSNSVCIMTHIAMKLGRKLAWDPAAEKFVGDAEANRRLDYPHRRPWVV